MITGFETETHELTDYELNAILPRMIAGLVTKQGKEKIITSKEAISKLSKPPYNLKINGARWRKLIHHIRVNHLIPCLKSTSGGYYITHDPEDLKEYIKSLNERINSISEIRDALTKDLKRLMEQKDNLTLS